MKYYKKIKKVKFLNLACSGIEKNGLLKTISKVLEHGRLVMGPEIINFEKKIASLCKRKYVISVGSGTDALFLAIKALNYKRGDEIITTPLSWIATANAISMNGLVPVFADINYDLNINYRSVESLITKKTKAVVVVNFTGKIADMDNINKVCKQNKLLLIEDGSQSFGATYKNKPSASFGIISTISHNPMKIFGAIGEAGSVLTNNINLKEKIEAFRYNGTVNKETCIEPSLNGRMDTIQAAVLMERLKNFKSSIKKRRKNAQFYINRLKNIVDLPEEKNYEHDIYYTFTIKAEKRDDLQHFLINKGIETKIHHPLLMPEQPAYNFNARGSFPNAKKLIKKVLCIPINEKLTEDDLEYVSNSINKFYGKKN